MRLKIGTLLLISGFIFGCVNSSESEPIDQTKKASELEETEEIDSQIAGTSLFTPLRQEVGILFRHYNAATLDRRLPETMGSGVAFFDFNNDNYPDIYFVNGAPIGDDLGQPTSGRLYQNLKNGQFEDVTQNSGLEESFFGMGVAVGDLENDGLLDIAVSGIDKLRVFKNLGNGRFKNITNELGIVCRGFGASLAFLDFDRDGYLDLFVTRYVEWSPETDIPCRPDGTNRTYCTPEVYPAITNCLLRNIEGKRFEDISDSSGLNQLPGKALGLVTLDYNNDGWQDLAVANDTEGNFLLVNQGDGTLSDVGNETGMAYSESGAARGGMGIDAGDIDGDGRIDIVIGNFSQEMTAFFRGSDSGHFMDDAAQVGIGLPTLMTLAFGILVEDFDNDGWLDLLLVNGHIEPEIAVTRQSQSYRQPPQFFRNLGKGKFESLDPNAIGLDDWLLVARGFASGDFDQDGDLDFVVSQNGGPAYFLKNNEEVNNWLQIALVGTQSNRVGYGSKVEIFTEEKVITRYLVSGRSYLSACDPTITVGLGTKTSVKRLEITWPSGTLQVIVSPKINSLIEVVEPLR